MAEPPRSRAAAVGDLISDPEHIPGVMFRHARELARLDALLAGCADPEIAARFQVANVRQDRLILVTPSAAWATRLRMLAPQLLQCLGAAGYGHLRHVDIRVAPLSRPAPETRRRRSLSPAAQQALEQMRRLSHR